MKNNETQTLNLLGLKRNINSQMPNDKSKTDGGEKIKENIQKKLALKKPEFYESYTENNTGINLDEKNGAQIDNINIKYENKEYKKFCQRCNCEDNLLFFNCLKNILDYLSKRKILISKNLFSKENIFFDTPKIICLNCLLIITKNKNEFEKFISSNKYKKIDDNDNPFNNLLENSNLKMFNNIETKKNKIKNQNGSNERQIKNSEKNAQDKKINSLLNNAQGINNNNIFNNGNINFDYLNNLNNLNYQILPAINYNMPFNQNIANLNLPYNNDLNNLIALNNILKNSELNDNNFSNLLQNPLLNYSDFLQNSLFNKPVGLFDSNNTGLLNLCPLPILNKNFSIDKKIENGSNSNLIINNINNKNEKEKTSKDESEIYEQNNKSKDFTIIQNKDFDEIFQITSNLYHKLLDIKNSRDLNIENKKVLNKDDQILFTNNLNFLNNLNEINNTNLSINQISNINNFNENDFKSNNNNLNNNLYSNQNTVENHININNINNFSNKNNKNNKN